MRNHPTTAFTRTKDMNDITKNIAIIQAIYAAFGRADVAGILAHLTDDAEISFQGASAEVPWHPTRRGHAEIPAFFGAIAEGVEFEAFEPLHFAASSDAVAVRIHLRYRVRRTGRVVDQQQVHWWGMRDGKSTGVTHFEDTAQVTAALR